MLSTLIHKELRAILLSPKFTATFAVCSILMLLSVYTGIKEYSAAVDQHDAATALSEKQLQGETSWGHLGTKIYRAPDPMQIFVSGVSNDIGRWSMISDQAGVKLRNSVYSDDPIFAVFRFVDFTFIVLFVLTLLAILFTYDSVNGEREDGTLKLVFSNAVPRARYLMAKCLGSWLGLVVPICIPILLSMLMVIAFGVSMTAEHWYRLFVLIGMSLMLFTFFIVMGVFISSMTKHSSVSFLVSLVLWVTFVMIIPRAGVMAAGNLVKVPRIADIEGQREGFANDKWQTFYSNMTQRWTQYDSESGTCGESNDSLMWAAMEQEEAEREKIEQEIEEYDIRLHEDLRQRKRAQEKLAFTLARFSPASSYQLAVMALAGTGVDSKSRYEDAMTEYRGEFLGYVEERIEETGDQGNISISFTMEDDGASDMSVQTSRNSDGLDVSGVPRFSPPVVSFADTVGPVVIDFGLLGLGIVLLFVGAFVAFLRYDVR